MTVVSWPSANIYIKKIVDQNVNDTNSLKSTAGSVSNGNELMQAGTLKMKTSPELTMAFLSLLRIPAIPIARFNPG